MSTVITPPTGYQPQTTYPEVKFKLTDVNPPSNLYLTREDVAVITSFNSATGLTVSVRGRMLRPDGRVIPFNQDHIPNTNRTSASTVIPMGEGFMLDMYVLLTAGSAKRGQCYVIVTVGRGDSTARIDHTVIIQGYVGTQVNQSWPGNSLEQPEAGPGFVRFITGTQPAAGASILETVPTGARWRLVSLYAGLTTAVAVANRQAFLAWDNGVSNFAVSVNQFTQAASLTYNYTWAQGYPQQAAIANIYSANPIPSNNFLAPGFRVSVGAFAIQAADQWTAPQYVVEEWISP